MMKRRGSLMKPRQLHYDVNYGIDRRSGWSAIVDGVVVVQFVSVWHALFAFVTGRAFRKSLYLPKRPMEQSP